jgi:hypothetical protein
MGLVIAAMAVAMDMYFKYPAMLIGSAVYCAVKGRSGIYVALLSELISPISLIMRVKA